MDKKITFLINSLATGGAEKVLSVIANALAKENFEVEIIFLEKNEFYELDKRIKKVYLSNSNGNESGLKKLIKLPWLAWKLRSYIKRNNISLIQSHVFRAHYVNIIAKLLGGKQKTQIAVSGIISFYKNEGLTGKINLFLIKYLFPKADLIIWKSKGMQYDAENLFKFNTKQIIINNPYNLEEIRKLADEQVKDFNFNPNKTYLINIGRMESFKKQEWIIRALKNLNKDIELILIGDGKNRKNLEELAKNLNLSKRVHFLGKKKNPYKYLKRSDIFVLSSDNGEGFPNVIVEALACGVPVIASDCISGPREILYPSSDIRKQLKKGDGFELGDYGVLYPVGDVESLSKSIMFLLNNKGIFDVYKSKAIERARDFSLERIIDKYKKVLLEEN